MVFKIFIKEKDFKGGNNDIRSQSNPQVNDNDYDDSVAVTATVFAAVAATSNTTTATVPYN